MRYAAVIAALAVGFASAAPAPSNEKLPERGLGVTCLAFCAPAAPDLPFYAACLAACTAAGAGGEPVDLDAVQSYLDQQK